MSASEENNKKKNEKENEDDNGSPLDAFEQISEMFGGENGGKSPFEIVELVKKSIKTLKIFLTGTSVVATAGVVSTVYVTQTKTEVKEVVKEVPVEIVRTVKDSTIKFNKIYFDYRSATISPSYYPYLEEVLMNLEYYKDKSIVITGHADNSGTADFNLKLSEQRALAVKNWLVERGISESRIQAVGKGNKENTIEEKDSYAKLKNRRIEISII